MSIKKVLYLGGTHADVPLINRIKDMGMHVITVGTNKEGIGHLYGDEYIYADFSNKELIMEMAKVHKIDYIIPSCSDFATLTGAYVSNELGLPGYDSYKKSQIIHNKNLFREFCLVTDVKVPRFFSVEQGYNSESIPEDIYPLIVKPVDSDSGKGISKVNSYKELELAISIAQSASRSKKIVVEEFISGSRHAASVIVKDNKIEFIFIDDEQYYLNPYMVAAASFPSKYFSAIVNPLSVELLKIIHSLNLVDGLLHVQFIYKDDFIYIIEACRRPPGEFYVKLVEYAKGTYYMDNIIKGYMGKVQCYKPKCNVSKNFFIRQCIMAKTNGIIENVELSNSIINNVTESYYWNGIGSKINNYLNEKLGVIFLEFDSNEQMQESIENMSNLIKVSINNTNNLENQESGSEIS